MVNSGLCKSDQYIFNPQYRPYSKGTLERGLTKVKGNRYSLKKEGAIMQDWWTDINKILSPTAEENLKYPTQKPRELLRRLIASASSPGSTVLDCFAGSATTAEVCNELGRKWIMCDCSALALQTAKHRLISSTSPPFSVYYAGEPSYKAQVKVKVLLEDYDYKDNLLSIRIEQYNGSDNLNILDFWEVDWDYDGVFNSSVQFVKKGDRFRGHLPLNAITLLPKDTNRRVAIKVYDLYTNCAREIIEVGP